MTKAITGAALGVIVMCLTACDGGKEQSTPAISNAEGEILPRSVTDDMLPYDILRSQPPLAEPEEEKTPSGAGNRARRDVGAASGEPAESSPNEESVTAASQSQPMQGAE